MIIILVEGTLIVTLFLYEIVFIQYTVTGTMLAAAAAFLFYTSKCDVRPLTFFRNNIISIVLVILAYQIRTEMLLLVFPLICVTGLCKWASEKVIFTKENAGKYFSVFGVILLGMILSEVVNMAAYSQPTWQRFNSYFDSRTKLYDFYETPPYEGNEDFYESIGLSRSEVTLLHNYNFGLDEKIDEKILAQISDYAAKLKAETTTFMGAFKKAVSDYRYRTFYETDYPMNLLVIILYVVVLLTALLNKHFRILWELPLLGFVRTGLWIFILYTNRYPNRITHSLYLMEIVILVALLLMELMVQNKQNRILSSVITVFCGVFSLLCISNSISKVHTEYENRESVNQDLYALQVYARANSENFYFWDVYSSVKYSEKMFVNVNNSISNYDIMGGWVCKSPLMQEKYQQYGIQSMEDGLLNQDHVFYVVQSPEPEGSYPLSKDWLPAYYRDIGKEIELIKTDNIRTINGEVFTVYKLQMVSE